MKYLLLSLAALFFTSCEGDSPNNPAANPPKCSIVSMSNLKYEDIWATMKIKVQNNGEGAVANNIGCFIKYKDGNLIVANGSVGFGSLNKYEMIERTIYFTDIDSTHKMNANVKREVILQWYDSNNKLYSVGP